MAPEQRIERLARAMTSGDPDRLVPVTYSKVVGYEDGSTPKTRRQTDMIAAWKFHEAEARAALSREQSRP